MISGNEYRLNMIDSTSLFLFTAANFIVVITPGPAIMYTVTRSLEQGKKAGFLSVYGLALGTLPHALAVSLGVAGLLASSIIAFQFMKYAGAAYLVWLGIQRFLHKDGGTAIKPRKTRSELQAFRDSFIVGVLNPKSVLFFLAFLPQFIDPSRGNPLAQILFLWLISQIMAIAIGSAYALAAAWLRQRFFNSRMSSMTANYFVGSVYILLGLAMALAGSKTKAR